MAFVRYYMFFIFNLKYNKYKAKKNKKKGSEQEAIVRQWNFMTQFKMKQSSYILKNIFKAQLGKRRVVFSIANLIYL